MYASLMRDGNPTVGDTAAHQLRTVNRYARMRLNAPPKPTPGLPLPVERQGPGGLPHPRRLEDALALAAAGGRPGPAHPGRPAGIVELRRRNRCGSALARGS